MTATESAAAAAGAGSAADPAPAPSSERAPAPSPGPAPAPSSGLAGYRRFLDAPVDIASLAGFRIIFGTVMMLGAIRFWHRGWIESLYLEPSFQFTYWGFAWVKVLPAWGMYLLFAVMAVSAALVALGLFYRVSITVFFFTFTYIELIDKTTYLNHYYLISILALLMIFLPLDRAWSIDAWRRPARKLDWAPRWCLWTIRLQIGLVYFFAGVAKLKPDWLWQAEPLATWLATHTDLPLVGPIMDETWLAYAASWLGAGFDLTIVGWLLWPRTRPFAPLALVGFHVITAGLFYLGMFPWIMIGCALIFLAPSWPRQLLRLGPPAPAPVSEVSAVRARPRWRQVGFALLGLHFTVQALLPLRYHLYPGDVCWTEEGFRYAWHVMLVEKTGRVIFHVTEPATGATWMVYPHEYLTPNQEKQMSTQPDMILALAHHIARDFAARGHAGVSVQAEAYVALNGRRSRLLIDPTVDLAVASDQLGPQPWILRYRTERAHSGHLYR